MNQDLTDQIQELASIYSLMGNSHKENAYRKLAGYVSGLPYTVAIGNMVDLHVSGGMKLKITEFLQTGVIAELGALKSNVDVQTYQTIGKIAGVGPKTVAKWIHMGVRDFGDLRRAVSDRRIVLTHMQELGLLHYSDLNKRIPRDEITALCDGLRKLVRAISASVKFEIAGSYRRGAESSGDIDVIIAFKRYNSLTTAKIVDTLLADPNFVDTMSIGPERVTYLYHSPISRVVRQIDILNMAMSDYWPAVLYFTGSWEFNTAIRGHAKQLGYLLNQHGLYRVSDSGKKQKIRVDSENAIFSILGLEYASPANRTGMLTKIKK